MSFKFERCMLRRTSLVWYKLFTKENTMLNRTRTSFNPGYNVKVYCAYKASIFSSNTANFAVFKLISMQTINGLPKNVIGLRVL